VDHVLSDSKFDHISYVLLHLGTLGESGLVTYNKLNYVTCDFL
jgi:hypothetical protein